MKTKKRQKIFITGGTGDVGKALIKKFSDHNYDVTFQYNKNDKEAQKIADSYNSKKIKIDFMEEFRFPKESFDVIINNAGVNITNDPSHKISISDWQKTLKINLTIPFLACKWCLPYMIKKNWGRIINISSIYGLHAAENYLPYNVSKHALSGLTKTIAKEYAKYGITCNEICPGPINSEMVRRIQ